MRDKLSTAFGGLVGVAVIVGFGIIVGGVAESVLDAYFPANWRTNLPIALGFVVAVYLAARIEKLERQVKDLSGSIAYLRREMRIPE